ncbi:ATP-binding protein [Sneathiella glossodoripedis]|uniref:ATP-binding protein n=1 Tax=Sneathiella glossodoripedis TaxID=418853 RepID=UPI00131F1AA1|nr:ATP-binding protein [Sneathiella glossodoripedis]
MSQSANQQVGPASDTQDTELQDALNKLAEKEAELEEAKGELARLSKLYDAAFYSSAQLASISDLETGRFIDVNDAWITTRGFRRDEAIGKTADELNIWGDDTSAREKILTEIQKTGSLRDYATQSVMRNGEVRDFLLNAEIIHLDGRDMLFFSGFDVTERKRYNQEQQSAQKLQAIGQLSGGIAHDFNNLLGIIQGNLELASEQLDVNNSLQKHLKTAIHCTERGAKITRKLLNFSANKNSDTKQVNSNQMIRELKVLIAKSATASVQFETHLTPKIWPVKVDPGELEDALINLCLNSKDAMPDGGRLSIWTENTSIGASYARLQPDIVAGDYVAITVEDTGHGLSNEVKEHMFEPFYTTKKDSGGSGLGLSMVFGFIKRVKGHIKVKSRPGEGCSFTLFIPRDYETPLTPAGAEKSDSKAPLPTGNEKILIVDDEKELAEIARCRLENLGYTVFTAYSGECALEILNEFPQIELMITDIIMPGELNGFKLAAAGRLQKASLKVLLTSGYSRADEMLTKQTAKEIDDIADDILPKPYSIDTLAIKVRETLDEIKKDRYIQAAAQG